LFSIQDKFDNLPALLRIYHNSSPYLRREIIICATRHNASDWIRELKESFSTMDIWNRRAFLYACSLLPEEERKFFLRQIQCNDLLDEFLVKWAKMR
jgi:hypothetical protein